MRISVTATTPELLERVRAYVPPGAQPCSVDEIDRRFSLTTDETGAVTLTRDEFLIGGAKGVDLDLALELLDSQIRLYLGRKARGAIFIHAGVVAHNGRAIVIPARSFGGKTTLVAALVKAGAIYFSDEFAVIDEDGLVRPYPKPLSMRSNGLRQTDHPVSSIGGVAGEDPLPLGAIVITSFKPGAAWRPRRLSAGAGAMALIENAVPAQERPEEVMRLVSRAALGSMVLESDRGEAEEVAPLLLADVTEMPDPAA